MAGELITRDRQAELQGVLLGPGTSYQFEQFNPWGGLELVHADVGYSGRHGSVGGVDLARARRVPMVIHVLGSSKQAAIEAALELTGAFQPSDVDVPFVFRAGDDTYRLNGRPRLAEPDPRMISTGTLKVPCRFIALDPRIYANTEQTGSTSFPTGGVGRTYDLTHDRVYGAAGSGGSISASNDGNTEAPWRLEITGPWVNPTITNVATDDQLALSISVGAGETLILDSLTESVLLGTAHRLNTIDAGSVWPTLAVGTNEIRIGGASGTGTATLFWRSAWL